MYHWSSRPQPPQYKHHGSHNFQFQTKHVRGIYNHLASERRIKPANKLLDEFGILLLTMAEAVIET